MPGQIAIAIVGFRNPRLTAKCVDALSRSNFGEFEIIICENGGHASAEELCSLLGANLPGGQKVTVIEAMDNPGFAGGVNRCITATPKARAWWIVNPDCEPHPEALGAMVSRLEKGDVDAVGGLILEDHQTLAAVGGRWRGWLARCVSLGKGAPLSSAPHASEVEAAIDYIPGASMLVSARFVERVGLMREDYFLYGEEVEWFLRAGKRGLKLGHAPESLVIHMQGGTTGSAVPVDQRPRLPIHLDERNKLHIVRDTMPFALPIAAVAMPILSFLRYGARGAWRQWGYALSGWWDGVLNRRGKPGWVG